MTPEADASKKCKLEEDNTPNAERGESLYPVLVVQAVNNFDRIEASNRIQQWYLGGSPHIASIQRFCVGCDSRGPHLR